MPMALRSLTTACTAGSNKSTAGVACEREGSFGVGVGESRGGKGEVGLGL